MSSIGKVFIVINLVLAALFVGSAASLIQTGQDWRTKYETTDRDLKAQLATSESETAAAQDEVTQVTQQKDRIATEKSTLEADKAALEDELNTEREINADMRERLTSIDGKLGDLESTNRQQESRIATLNEQVGTLRGERDSALDARDAAEGARATAERSSETVSRERDELEVALGRANEKVASKDAKLAEVAKLYKVDLNNLNDQPDLSGRVTSVDSSLGTTVVVINLGKNDGVKPGHTFDVYDGGVYKGKIYVETVNSSQSAATISLVGDGTIGVDDAVVSRL